MAYTRVNWQDSPSHATPLSAENLNVMDEGIKNLDDSMTEATGDITTLETTVSGHTTSIGTLANLTTTEKSSLVGAINEVDADVSDLKEELSDTTTSALSTHYTSARYRVENDTLAIVSSSLYDISNLVLLEGYTGFSVDYNLTPSAGYGHTPICYFSAMNEITATLIDHAETVEKDHVYSIPDGAKYVGFMIPTGTHPNITLYGSRLNKIENEIDELQTEIHTNGYGCAFPISDLRQTVGISETFYYDTAITPNKTTYGQMSVGGDYSAQATKGLTLPNTTALEAINGFIWRMYNPMFVEVANYLGANGYGGLRHIVEENLSDCSLLAIGDSTVDSDTMTADLLSYFASKSKTLTLLGTLGTGDNKNEGRSGWKASDYLTGKTYGGVTNPFYNPSTQTFDFDYYMTNQGYSTPSFVIIQLGINDLAAAASKENIWSCIQTMIDSVLDYDASIKILLNLPTTPNSDQSKMFTTLSVYWNKVVKYNQYAQSNAKALYAESSVRCSYCHLILDPDEDILDGVHPKSAGYAKMALEVINQINCWQNGV